MPSLKPGGRAAALEFVPNEDRVSPPMAAAFSLTMLATTASGDAYTLRDLETMYRAAGFAGVVGDSVRPDRTRSWSGTRSEPNQGPEPGVPYRHHPPARAGRYQLEVDPGANVGSGHGSHAGASAGTVRPCDRPALPHPGPAAARGNAEGAGSRSASSPRRAASRRPRSTRSRQAAGRRASPPSSPWPRPWGCRWRRSSKPARRQRRPPSSSRHASGRGPAPRVARLERLATGLPGERLRGLLLTLGPGGTPARKP